MINKLQHYILGELPAWDAQQRMAPPLRTAKPLIPHTVRQSAVCTLLYYRNNQLHTLLIKRTEDGKTHSGQISFPGGKMDAQDYSLTFCALRECEEEIGLSKNNILVLGSLSQLYIPPSNFIVTPVLSYAEQVEQLTPSIDEVAEIIEVPLDELFDDANKTTYTVRRSDDHTRIMETPAYQFRGHIIWGATAMMLAEFEEILNRLQ